MQFVPVGLLSLRTRRFPTIIGVIIVAFISLRRGVTCFPEMCGILKWKLIPSSFSSISRPKCWPSPCHWSQTIPSEQKNWQLYYNATKADIGLAADLNNFLKRQALKTSCPQLYTSQTKHAQCYFAALWGNEQDFNALKIYMQNPAHSQTCTHSPPIQQCK